MSGERNVQDENAKRRRHRSLAIAWSLVAFMTLFFIVTIVRLGGSAPGASH